MKTVNGTTVIQPKPFGAGRVVLVIVDGVSFHTSIRKIRDGVGNNKEINAAVKSTLEALEYLNGYKKRCGIAQTRDGKNVQIDVI